ncbi:hypothetical protein ECAD30_46900 [Escherichia coli AD30]|nr:hypothetical protein ECAD30_46900 [Escherichia coli AD30]
MNKGIIFSGSAHKAMRSVNFHAKHNKKKDKKDNKDKKINID